VIKHKDGDTEVLNCIFLDVETVTVTRLRETVHKIVM